MWNLVEPELLTVEPMWNLVEPELLRMESVCGTSWNLAEPELFRMKPLCGTLWNLKSVCGTSRNLVGCPKPPRNFIGRTASLSGCWGKTVGTMLTSRLFFERFPALRGISLWFATRVQREALGWEKCWLRRCLGWVKWCGFWLKRNWMPLLYPLADSQRAILGEQKVMGLWQRASFFPVNVLLFKKSWGFVWHRFLTWVVSNSAAGLSYFWRKVVFDGLSLDQQQLIIFWCILASFHFWNRSWMILVQWSCWNMLIQEIIFDFIVQSFIGKIGSNYWRKNYWAFKKTKNTLFLGLDASACWGVPSWAPVWESTWLSWRMVDSLADRTASSSGTSRRRPNVFCLGGKGFQKR